MVRFLQINSTIVVLLLSSCIIPVFPPENILPTTTLAILTPTEAPQPSPTETMLPETTPEHSPIVKLTATAVLQPSSTITRSANTPSPTHTMTHTLTPLISPTMTQTQVPPPDVGDVIYAVQPGTPVAMMGFSHPELGCNWMGIGGQVFAYDSTPVLQLVVHLSGVIGGKTLDLISVTGSSTIWGQGGYELKIADTPIESSGTVWIQFLDLNGRPVSDRIFLTTYSDCERNSILLNMKQVKDYNPYRNYLPIIQK